jgi:hypothetical protein
MKDEPILATMTGENFQPVRLHYRVFDHNGLLRAFRKLRCVARDQTRPRWVWLYDHEARGLRFRRSYAEFPPHLRPVILGSFFERGNDRLLLDTRSCERAVHAIPFFDRHIPRTVARVTDAEVVNKLFPATGNAELTPDRLFDQQPATFNDPNALLRQIRERVADVADPQERLRLALDAMQSAGRQPLAEIERLPVTYYEDGGIHGFELAFGCARSSPCSTGWATPSTPSPTRSGPSPKVVDRSFRGRNQKMYRKPLSRRLYSRRLARGRSTPSASILLSIVTYPGSTPGCVANWQNGTTRVLPGATP